MFITQMSMINSLMKLLNLAEPGSTATLQNNNIINVGYNVFLRDVLFYHGIHKNEKRIRLCCEMPWWWHFPRLIHVFLKLFLKFNSIKRIRGSVQSLFKVENWQFEMENFLWKCNIFSRIKKKLIILVGFIKRVNLW